MGRLNEEASENFAKSSFHSGTIVRRVLAYSLSLRGILLFWLSLFISIPFHALTWYFVLAQDELLPLNINVKAIAVILLSVASVVIAYMFLAIRTRAERTSFTDDDDDMIKDQ